MTVPTSAVLALTGGAAGLGSVVVAAAGIRRLREVGGMTPPPWLPTLVLAAVLGGVSGLRFGAQPWLPGLAVLTGSAAVLTVTDLQWHRLPAAVVVPTYAAVALLFTGAAVVAEDTGRLGGAVVAGVVTGLVFLAYVLLRPDAIGLGDVKLAPLLGFVLGWWGPYQVVLGFLLAYGTCAVMVVVSIALRRMSWRSEFPLGPFLLGGCLAAVLLAPT